jgi:hypothetical protein
MHTSSSSHGPADTDRMRATQQGAGGSQTLALGAMVVAIAVLGMIAVVRLTSNGDTTGTPAPSSTASPGGAASVFPAARDAADVATQSELHNAMVGALTYFTTSSTYAGFTAATASSIEPSVQYADGGPAVADSVSIRGASAEGIVLVERSASGTVFCVGKAGSAQVEGRTDATTAAACTGGW